MSTAESATPTPADSQPTRRTVVALVGNPNTGKSTLFNALTGGRARIGNFPGCTVEKKVGRFRCEGRELDLVDLPGTYSLSPRSLDELVSVDVLLGRTRDLPKPDAVVCIVDASNLERNLYLVSQVRELGLPTVVVLNMQDVARKRGITIDPAELGNRLGARVVETQAHTRKGLDDVRRAILAATDDELVAPSPKLFPEGFYDEVLRLSTLLDEAGVGASGWDPPTARRSGTTASSSDEAQSPKVPTYIVERLLLDVGGELEIQLTEFCGAGLRNQLTESRQRLAENGCKVPATEARVRYAWAREMLEGVHTRPAERPKTTSDRIDGWLTHRFAGLLFFAGLMFLVFMSIFAWAGPFMDLIEAGQERVAGLVTGAMAPGPLRSLLVDGVIAGVGGVIIFVPQICLLFLFIAILEDCGYMARAAFLMDRLMTPLGLSGKSFVPLMSSFACAIPGVMATRTIESRRDRMVTMLVAPLMSCSARLPVYILLIALFLPEEAVVAQGLVMFAMYALGVIVAAGVAWLLKKTLFKGETPPFVMELPSYKWPSSRIVLARVYDRGKAFVTRAGTLIFATTIVVWALGYFPGDHSEVHGVQAELESLDEEDEANADRIEQLAERENELSAALIETSLLGRMGHAIEPAVEPLGWDWRIGVGAIASFPAREVIVATLGTIYSLGGDVDEEDEGLRGSMAAAKWPDGRKVYTTPVCLSVMVFFALCAQCGATLMIIQRETNSWRWPLFTFAYMTALAYVGALLTYQVGRLIAG